MAYTTTTNIANALDRALTPEEIAYFNDVLSDAIDEYIDSSTDTSFGSEAEVTVYASGGNTDTLTIPTMNTITAVQNDEGTAIATTEYAEYPKRGDERLALCRKNGKWDSGLENYRIVGRMGYKVLPKDIVAVATEIAVHVLTSLTAEAQGVKSEKTGDWAVTYIDGEKPLSARSMAILAQYRRLSRRI